MGTQDEHHIMQGNLCTLLSCPNFTEYVDTLQPAIQKKLETIVDEMFKHGGKFSGRIYLVNGELDSISFVNNLVDCALSEARAGWKSMNIPSAVRPILFDVVGSIFFPKIGQSSLLYTTTTGC